MAVMTWLAGALVLLAPMVCGQERPHAGTLRRLWDLDLRRVLDRAGARYSDDLPVFALRFSPDGGQLAAVVDWYGPKGAEKSHLVIIPVNRPTEDARVFEIEAGVDDNESAVHRSFGWSPSGDIVQAGNKLLRLNANEHLSCELSGYGWGMFITEDLVIARNRKDIGSSTYWTKPVSHFTFFDRDCRPKGNWDLPEEWSIVEASTERALLSVSRTTGLAQTENLIVDPIARKVLHRWPGDSGPGGYFADDGRAICNTSDPDLADKAPVSCWDVDTGEKIAEAPAINGGGPMAVAQRASRIVGSDYNREKIPFSNDYRDIFKRRVLWDFRNGGEIVSWRPQFQTWNFQLFVDPRKPLKHVNDPFRFAISPDGQYIVEGGSGRIHLYRVEL